MLASALVNIDFEHDICRTDPAGFGIDRKIGGGKEFLRLAMTETVRFGAQLSCRQLESCCYIILYSLRMDNQLEHIMETRPFPARQSTARPDIVNSGYIPSQDQSRLLIISQQL